MKNAVKRSVVVILLLALAISAGFGIDRLVTAVRNKNYPRAYSEYVVKYSRMYGVPEDLIYAVIKVESDFKYDAESTKSASGLMQLMPGTYEWLCDKVDIEYDESKINDPDTNIRCGTYYLAYLHDEFVIWDTVYAAYNAGHGTVRRWLESDEYGRDGHLTNIPYPETREYVKKIAAAREIYKDLLEKDKASETTYDSTGTGQ